METAEADTSTEEASTQSDTTTQADEEDADAATEADVATIAETDSANQASDSDAVAETETTDAVVAADTTDDSSNVQMRYPTDPATGLTLYDQGMVEVIVEPEPEVAEEESTAEATEATDTAGTGDEVVAETTQEDASAENELADGTTAQTITEMRYPTDPSTGATIFEGGRVEVSFEEMVIAPAAEMETDSEDASSVAESTESRLPVDPVTGATIYPDAQSDEVALASSASDADASESTEDSNPNSLPTDPVTGTTIYESAESDNASASDEQADVTAQVDSNRLPVDPVTGATIHESAENGPAADAASSLVTSFIAAENRTADIGGISRQFGTVFGTTANVIAKSVDETSAKNALPRLESASNLLDELSEQFQSLPDYATAAVGKVVQNQMARLQPLADTSMSKAGVGPVLSPVLIPMMEQLGSIAE